MQTATTTTATANASISFAPNHAHDTTYNAEPAEIFLK
jgi:hypothetical protein